MLYVGIDQHRKQLTVHVRDDRGEVVLRRQVSTQWDKVRAVLDDLYARAAPTAGYFAIVEVMRVQRLAAAASPRPAARLPPGVSHPAREAIVP